MGIFSSLNSEQKEAFGLLSIGTFLEYFDLMLYVHMAVLLNDIFFPKSDPYTHSILTAFAFCSTYVLRPFGALLFGYIGDNIGRKATIVITTLMMSLSCVVMAMLPTYAQIGIMASWIVTLCRIVQGLASMGEVVGANIYLTETIPHPYRYSIVAGISVAASFGPVFALLIGTLVTTLGSDWRFAFWIGAVIAFVGTVARTRLRETPEFVDMKRRLSRSLNISKSYEPGKQVDFLMTINPLHKVKVKKKIFIAYTLIQCGWPVFFYFTYMYCGEILKNQFQFSGEDVIAHNFVVSLFQLGSFIVMMYAVRTIAPLSILKVRGIILACIVLCIPLALGNLTASWQLMTIQILCISFAITSVPAVPLFIEYFPVFKRFTCDSFSYALSRAVMYIVTSFGIVIVTDQFSHTGLLFIMVPALVGYFWGVNYFENLERNYEVV